eukprot:scaffold73947_cov32-Cyclotella_meneghiniana.AAC.2
MDNRHVGYMPSLREGLERGWRPIVPSFSRERSERRREKASFFSFHQEPAGPGFLLTLEKTCICSNKN